MNIDDAEHEMIRMRDPDKSIFARQHAINNGFWDRSPKERAARTDAVCEKYGTVNFHDLSPEQRGEAYDHP